MTPLFRVLVLCLVAAMVEAPASGQLLQPSHAPTNPTDISKDVTAVVARVNGVPLTQAALDREMQRVFPYYSMHGGAPPKEYEGEIRRKALNNLIQEELVYQEAKRRKLPIPAAEWRRRLREIRADYKSAAEFEAAMKKYFGSKAAFEKKLRHDILLDRIWLLEVKRKAVVSDAEVRRYYERNRARFVQPESVALQSISTLFQKNAGASDKEAARRRAEDILPKARTAKTYEEFGRLAEKVSEDDWRVMMGDHKFVHRGTVQPEFEVAFRMKPGETSGIIASSVGYHIIRVNKHEVSKKLTFVAVAPSIRAMLEKERLSQRAKNFQESLHKAAKIEML